MTTHAKKTKQAPPSWTCTNPNCCHGMGYRIIDRRNRCGDGTWCVDCKGGNASPPGHGDLRARGFPDPAADAWDRSQERMKARQAWEAEAKEALAVLPGLRAQLANATAVIDRMKAALARAVRVEHRGNQFELYAAAKDAIYEAERMQAP